MNSTGAYEVKEFPLSGLNGISDQTLETHFKLYEGYVKETNRLTDHRGLPEGWPGRSGGDACLFRA